MQSPPYVTSYMLSNTNETVPSYEVGFTDLNWPPNGMEWTGIILIALMNMLASAGGIGGGGIMTPFLMIFMKLPITECIPLANSFALISAITRFVLNYNQAHPYRPNRKVIDYEVVALTMPLVYLGTMMGVQIG